MCCVFIWLVAPANTTQTQVVIDPYAKAVLSRRRYGELGAALDYEKDEVLGLAATWPQAAAFLPKPSVGLPHLNPCMRLPCHTQMITVQVGKLCALACIAVASALTGVWTSASVGAGCGAEWVLRVFGAAFVGAAG